MSRRPLWLWGGLATTLAATWYAAGVGEGGVADDLSAVAPSSRPAVAPGRAPMPAPASAAIAPAPITSPVTRRGDERMAPPRTALMAAHSWAPPPPPPAAAVAAPPPQAPALPFRYLGRLDESGGTAVFLSEANPQARPLVVRTGDRVRDYEVVAINAQGVTFNYLPLNQKQQLLFGSSN